MYKVFLEMNLVSENCYASEGKVMSVHAMKAYVGVEVLLHTFLSALLHEPAPSPAKSQSRSVRFREEINLLSLGEWNYDSLVVQPLSYSLCPVSHSSFSLCRT